MNFLEFAVWGAYLTSMGNYLGKAGMGGEISWFYAIQGIVSIFMPTLMGIIADKAIQPGRLLGICQFSIIILLTIDKDNMFSLLKIFITFINYYY